MNRWTALLGCAIVSLFLAAGMAAYAGEKCCPDKKSGTATTQPADGKGCKDCKGCTGGSCGGDKKCG